MSTNKKLRWGIIGLGKIAKKFAKDLQLSNNSVLYGVASRDISKAKAFAEQYRSDKYFGSYEEMAANPDLDIIYIATPHAFHMENTLMCLRSGKHVLCEKPLGMDSEEVKIMIDEAKRRNLFLMEAIWTRFVPATEYLIDLLNKKAIGDIIYTKADFGFRAELNFEGRVYNKSLGGGSLLDIGIYPIYLSMLTQGVPLKIDAMARMSPTKVDSFCAMLFDYGDKSKAMLESTFEAETPTTAMIYGTKGSIKVHNRFHHSEKLTVNIYNETTRDIDLKYIGEGYYHEIQEVCNCIINKQIQSQKLPLSESLQLSMIMDRVKDKIGLKYESRM